MFYSGEEKWFFGGFREIFFKIYFCLKIILMGNVYKRISELTCSISIKDDTEKLNFLISLHLFHGIFGVSIELKRESSKIFSKKLSKFENFEIYHLCLIQMDFRKYFWPNKIGDIKLHEKSCVRLNWNLFDKSSNLSPCLIDDSQHF